MTHVKSCQQKQISSSKFKKQLKNSKTMSCIRSGVPVLFFSLVAAVRYLARRVNHAFSLCVYVQ